MLDYKRKKKKKHLCLDFVESFAVIRKQQSKEELEWWMTVPIMVNNHTVGLCGKFCRDMKAAIKGGAWMVDDCAYHGQ